MSGDAKVNVAVRVRRILPHEVARQSRSCISHPVPAQVCIADRQAFTFDHVFPEHADQGELYRDCVHPMLEQCMQGYNVTIMAYGQTGSGKTYTMGGAMVQSREQQGIMPRFLADAFERVTVLRQSRRVTLHMSVMELYNEEVIDLLRDPSCAAGNLVICEGESGIQVSGLSEVEVETLSQAMDVIRRGFAHRTTASTLMNAVSSRSHAIVSLAVHVHPHTSPSDDVLGDGAKRAASPGAEEPADGSARDDAQAGAAPAAAAAPAALGVSGSVRSKITFVDLAGSERLKRTGAQGDRMREGININSGLLALGNVINALTTSARKGERTHVPYRDSKLTRLLQDALGGNSRTLFLACVSPCDSDIDETYNTLRYANRAKSIRNRAVVNRDSFSQQLLCLGRRLFVTQCLLVRQLFASPPPGEGQALSADALREQAAAVLASRDAAQLLAREDVRAYLEQLQRLADAQEEAQPLLLPASAGPPAPPPSRATASSATSLGDEPSPTAGTGAGAPPAAQPQDRAADGASDDEASEGEGWEDDAWRVVQLQLDVEQEQQAFEEQQRSADAQMRAVDSEISSKEQLLLTLKDSLQHYDALKHRHEELRRTVETLEQERAGLKLQVKDSEQQQRRQHPQGAPEPPLLQAMRSRLQELKAQLQSARQQQAAQLDTLRVAERQSRKAEVLEQQLQRLRTARARLTREQREDAVKFRDAIRRKNLELAGERKAARKCVQQIGRLRMTTRRQEVLLNRRQEAILRSNQKLADTEKMLGVLLTRHRIASRAKVRQSLARVDTWRGGPAGGQQQAPGAAEPAPGTATQGDEASLPLRAKHHLLLSEVERAVQRDEAAAVLVRELARRTDLLRELAALSKRRRQAQETADALSLTDTLPDGTHALAEEEAVAGRGAAHAVEAAEEAARAAEAVAEVERDMEARELRLAVCEAAIEERRAVLQADDVGGAGAGEEGADGDALSPQQQQLLAGTAQPEAHQLLAFLLGDLREAWLAQRRAAREADEARAAHAEAEAEARALRCTLQDASARWAHERTDMQARYEQELQALLQPDDADAPADAPAAAAASTPGGTGKAEVASAAARSRALRRQAAALAAAKSDLAHQLAQAQAATQAARQEAAAAAEEAAALHDRIRALEMARTDDSARAQVASQQFVQLWRELGVRSEERDATFQALTGALATRCEEEVQRLTRTKQQAEQEVELLRDSVLRMAAQLRADAAKLCPPELRHELADAGEAAAAGPLLPRLAAWRALSEQLTERVAQRLARRRTLRARATALVAELELPRCDWSVDVRALVGDRLSSAADVAALAPPPAALAGSAEGGAAAWGTCADVLCDEERDCDLSDTVAAAWERAVRGLSVLRAERVCAVEAALGEARQVLSGMRVTRDVLAAAVTAHWRQLLPRPGPLQALALAARSGGEVCTPEAPDGATLLACVQAALGEGGIVGCGPLALLHLHCIHLAAAALHAAASAAVGAVLQPLRALAERAQQWAAPLPASAAALLDRDDRSASVRVLEQCTEAAAALAEAGDAVAREGLAQLQQLWHQARVGGEVRKRVRAAVQGGGLVSAEAVGAPTGSGVADPSRLATPAAAALHWSSVQDGVDAALAEARARGLSDYHDALTAASAALRAAWGAAERATVAVAELARVRARIESLRGIVALMEEVRGLEARMVEFERAATDKARLRGNSARLLEEERFRKAAAARYPRLLKKLARDVATWEGEQSEQLQLHGKAVAGAVASAMETNSGLLQLMHLTLGVERRRSVGIAAEEDSTDDDMERAGEQEGDGGVQLECVRLSGLLMSVPTDAQGPGTLGAEHVVSLCERPQEVEAATASPADCTTADDAAESVATAARAPSPALPESPDVLSVDEIAVSLAAAAAAAAAAPIPSEDSTAALAAAAAVPAAHSTGSSKAQQVRPATAAGSAVGLASSRAAAGTSSTAGRTGGKPAAAATAAATAPRRVAGSKARAAAPIRPIATSLPDATGGETARSRAATPTAAARSASVRAQARVGEGKVPLAPRMDANNVVPAPPSGRTAASKDRSSDFFRLLTKT